MRRQFTKKLAAGVLVAAMSISLAACGGKSEGLSDALGNVGTFPTSTETATTTEASTAPDTWEPYEIADEDRSPIDMGIGINKGGLSDKYGDGGVDLNSAEALAEQKKFDEYTLDAFRKGVVVDSVTMHYNVIHPENYGIEVPTATYGDADMTEEAVGKDLEEIEKDEKELAEFDRSLLTKDQKITYDIIASRLTLSKEGNNFPYMYEAFSYSNGLQTNLPIALAEYKLYTKEDVETYLELIKMYPDYVDQWLNIEHERVERGYFMNSYCAGEVIRQCEEFIADPDDNLLIATFNTHVENVEGLKPEEIAAYKKANENAVKECVIPAYKNIITFFRTYRNSAKNELGICYLENGKEYYAYMLKSQGITNYTPEEVIARLDTAIDKEMDIMMDLVYSNIEAISDYYDDMENDTVYGEIDPATTIREFEKYYSDRFPDMPEIDFTVQNVHPSLKNIVSPAFYMTPALDDIEHNSIYLNVGEGTSGMWHTLAHEGIAGHMFQFCYFLGKNPAPIRAILDCNAYAEGWATYVHQQSYAYYPNYKHPEYAQMECLNSELGYLIPARVDIGVHYEGWDLEKTKDYLVEKGLNGEAAEEVYDAVIADPANYQMYVMGWLTLEDLRAHAKVMLKDKYDEKEFNQAILDAGPCPMDILEDWVDSYISEKLG